MVERVFGEVVEVDARAEKVVDRAQRGGGELKKLCDMKIVVGFAWRYTATTVATGRSCMMVRGKQL